MANQISRKQVQELLRAKFYQRTPGMKTDNKIKYMATGYLIDWARRLGLLQKWQEEQKETQAINEIESRINSEPPQ